MNSTSPPHAYRIVFYVRLYILEQCSSQKTWKLFFWVTVTHLEETEVPWCQPAQSDDHLCCRSFLDDQQPSCRWGKICHRSTCISTKVTAFLCSLFVGLWGMFLRTKYHDPFHLACPTDHGVTTEIHPETSSCKTRPCRMSWLYFEHFAV